MILGEVLHTCLFHDRREAPLELIDSAGQGERGIDFELPRQIHNGKEKVPELLFNSGVVTSARRT
jgi:hypothetical protein